MAVPTTIIHGALAHSSEQAALIRVPRLGAPFVFAFTPTVIDLVPVKGKIGDRVFDGSKVWLPTPIVKFVVAGAGNVEMPPEGAPATAARERGQYRTVEIDGTKEKGEVWIRPDEALGQVPAEFLPKGVPAGSYRRTLQVKEIGQDSGVTHYCTAWDGYEVVTPNRPAAHNFDANGLNLWIASLVLAGKIPAAHPAIVRQKAGRKKVAAGRVEAVAWAPDVRDAKVGDAQKSADEAAKAKILEAA